MPFGLKAKPGPLGPNSLFRTAVIFVKTARPSLIINQICYSVNVRIERSILVKN